MLKVLGWIGVIAILIVGLPNIIEAWQSITPERLAAGIVIGAAVGLVWRRIREILGY